MDSASFRIALNFPMLYARRAFSPYPFYPQRVRMHTLLILDQAMYPTKKNSPIWIGDGRPDLSRSENLQRGSKSYDIMRL
jgi:hypothetical protein